MTAPAGSEDAGLAQMGSIPAWLRLCQRPMRGFYGAETTCARPAAHPGDHYPAFTGEWPEEVHQAAAARVEAARAEGARAALLHVADRFAFDGTGDRDHLLRVARWLRGNADAVAVHISTTRPGDVRGTDHTKETGDE